MCAVALVLTGVLSPASARADTPPAMSPDDQLLCPAQPSPGFLTCFGMRRTDVRQPATDAAAPAGYGPVDLRAAYNLPTSGSTVTVAVVDAFDNPQAEPDLAVYRSTFGLSPCTTANGCFRKINQYGQASPLPPPDTGWAAEISLDLDTVSAVCPTCHLLLVEANDQRTVDFGTAVTQAARSGAAVISNSYGGPEDGREAQQDPLYYHPGIAVVASTGDDGYGPDYPATSPYVLAVGGTTLTRAQNSRGWTESAWRKGGAGCSTDEPRPPVQQAVNTGCTTRAVADVSAIADPATGIAGYDSYRQNGWQIFGGTSVAAPLIAGIYGLVGGIAPGTQAATLAYQRPSAFYDITTGGDGPCSDPQLCAAGLGYDQPTGLGTPHGTTAFTP